MPLDSQRLPKDTRNYLHELPIDDECKNDVDYQTKIGLYEQNCKDCGFSKVILSTYTDDGRQRITVFEGAGAVNRANEMVGKYRCNMERTCTYPLDITTKNDKEELPTLSEIISNTCQFWHIGKLNIPADKDTAFIEVEELQTKMENLVVGSNIIEERISQK